MFFIVSFSLKFFSISVDGLVFFERTMHLALFFLLFTLLKHMY